LTPTELMLDAAADGGGDAGDILVSRCGCRMEDRLSARGLGREGVNAGTLLQGFGVAVNPSWSPIPRTGGDVTLEAGELGVRVRRRDDAGEQLPLLLRLPVDRPDVPLHEPLRFCAAGKIRTCYPRLRRRGSALS